MFDHRLRPIIDRPLNAVARRLVRLGIGANQITLIGFGIGMAGAITIAWQQYLLGLILILASRAADGLDGAVARANGSTSDRGGFLDIVLDFLFYSSIPFAFALAAPEQNAVAAAFDLVIHWNWRQFSWLCRDRRKTRYQHRRAGSEKPVLPGRPHRRGRNNSILMPCLFVAPALCRHGLGFCHTCVDHDCNPNIYGLDRLQGLNKQPQPSLDLANPYGQTNPLGGQQALVHQSP